MDDTIYLVFGCEGDWGDYKEEIVAWYPTIDEAQEHADEAGRRAEAAYDASNLWDISAASAEVSFTDENPEGLFSVAGKEYDDWLSSMDEFVLLAVGEKPKWENELDVPSGCNERFFVRPVKRGKRS